MLYAEVAVTEAWMRHVGDNVGQSIEMGMCQIFHPPFAAKRASHERYKDGIVKQGSASYRVLQETHNFCM